MHPDGSPEGVRSSVDNCLRLLKGKKKIDIFECARVDKNIPIEITLKTLDEEYVKTGKIGGIALSEVGAATIEKAVNVTKIVAAEVELVRPFPILKRYCPLEAESPGVVSRDVVRKMRFVTAPDPALWLPAL
jgi:aryl-alcohol dehydrogenase-like predicted oxidoreductase